MLDEIQNSRFVVGTKQTQKAVGNKEAKKVLIAKDVNDYMRGKLEEVCRENGVAIEYVDSMKELGKACGISRDAAAAAILK